MAVTNKTVLFFAEVPIISVESENRVNHPHDPLFHMIYSNEMNIFDQFSRHMSLTFVFLANCQEKDFTLTRLTVSVPVQESSSGNP